MLKILIADDEMMERDMLVKNLSSEFCNKVELQTDRKSVV